MKKFILFLSLLIFNYQLLIATIRYVSHSGSNTPPYTTWETAADSIMSAITISTFGDTIYVANGVYEEQVVMIPGLSLIGAGMDSCVIDTRNLVNTSGFISVDIADSCLFKGFQILVYTNSTKGYGIAIRGNDLVTQNKIITAWYGIYVGYTGTKTPMVHQNNIENVDIGVEIFNSSCILQKNIISTDPNSSAAIVAGVRIEAFDNTYTPLIDSNIIYANTRASGIYKSIGSRPTISNNIILLNPAEGIYLSYSDSTKVFNNLIYGRGYGIDNYETQYLHVYNNYIGGEISRGIFAGPENVIGNNVITGAEIGIEKWLNQSPPIIKYNVLWNDSVNFLGFTVDTTNISSVPLVMNDDTTQ